MRANLIVFVALVVALVVGSLPTATATYLMFTAVLRQSHRLRRLVRARTRESHRVPRAPPAHGSRDARRADAAAQPRGVRRPDPPRLAAGAARSPDGGGHHDRHRLLQVLQRSLRPHRGRRLPAPRFHRAARRRAAPPARFRRALRRRRTRRRAVRRGQGIRREHFTQPADGGARAAHPACEFRDAALRHREHRRRFGRMRTAWPSHDAAVGARRPGAVRRETPGTRPLCRRRHPLPQRVDPAATTVLPLREAADSRSAKAGRR